MKLIEIQEALKKDFFFDVVGIQSGNFFNFFNEDVQVIRELFNTKTYQQGNNIVTSYPSVSVERIEELLKSSDLKYAIVESEKVFKGDLYKIVRKVTRTSNINAMGREFMLSDYWNKPKPKISKGSKDSKESKYMYDFLDFLLNGQNPASGEKLPPDSVWRHPQIMKDIATLILKRKNENDSYDSNTIKREFEHLTHTPSEPTENVPELEKKTPLIWYFDTNLSRGDYILLNGDKTFVSKIVRIVKSVTEVRKFARSKQPASNGVMYDYYISVNKHSLTKEELDNLLESNIF